MEEESSPPSSKPLKKEVKKRQRAMPDSANDPKTNPCVNFEMAALQCSLNRGVRRKEDCAQIFQLADKCRKEFRQASLKAKRERRPQIGCYTPEFDIPQVPPPLSHTMS